jgi:hypothetical protein
MSPRVVEDRPLSGDIEAVAEAIQAASLGAAVQAEVGELR